MKPVVLLSAYAGCPVPSFRLCPYNFFYLRRSAVVWMSGWLLLLRFTSLPFPCSLMPAGYFIVAIVSHFGSGGSTFLFTALSFMWANALPFLLPLSHDKVHFTLMPCMLDHTSLWSVGRNLAPPRCTFYSERILARASKDGWLAWCIKRSFVWPIAGDTDELCE